MEGKDAWNKVGHRRGIIKSERPPVLGGLFAFGVPAMRTCTWQPCDKNVWNVFELLGVCAGPEGVRQDAWNKVGHRRGIN